MWVWFCRGVKTRAQHWAGYAALKCRLKNGLEGEASSNSNNAHDSSQVGPSSDIASFSSPSFILLVEEKS